MPRTANKYLHMEQGWRKPTLLSQLLWAGIFCLLLSSFVEQQALAIPPNTPITNTAEVSYEVAGQVFGVADSEVIITSPGSGNSPPSGITAGALGVDENLTGAIIGTLVINDSDPGDSHILTTADPRFLFVDATLRLVDGVSLDHEDSETVSISVTATDSAGGSVTQDVVIQVADVNETPVLSISSVTATANVAGAVVGLLAIADPDEADAHVFAVDNPRFEVIGGELKLLDGDSLSLGELAAVQVTVTDSGGLTDVLSIDVTGVPPGSGSGVNSQITAYRVAPTGAGSSASIPGGICESSSGPVNLSDPVDAFGNSWSVPGFLELAQSQVFKTGESLFVQVIDPDANLADTTLDSVTVSLLAAQGDEEVIRLTETEAASGVFFGYVASQLGPIIDRDCVLSLEINETVRLEYVDLLDSTDRAEVSVVYDPVSRVFSSSNGQPIDGAVIQLLDAATGNPANVFADDGTTAVSSSQLSGSNGVDGGFRFPFVLAGSYVLQVTAPNRFIFPSDFPDNLLQALPGAPFVLNSASRGQTFSVSVPPNFRVDVPLDLQPLIPTESSIELLSASSGGTLSTVNTSQCLNGSGFVNAPDPESLELGLIALPEEISLVEAGRFARGDAAFIRIQDLDQDVDPFSADFVDVTVTVDSSSDQETIRLRETGDSTGIFIGYVQTQGTADAVGNNCLLEAPPASQIEVVYEDPTDSSDLSSAAALLDPGFSIISSATGMPLDGATITLIEAATGASAVDRVFADDGVTAYPATVVSGGSAFDESGRAYQFAPGSFFFPEILPGEYQLEVTPAPSHLFPTILSNSELAQLEGGPFTVVVGSRGEAFSVVAGTPSGFDIPLDPIDASVLVTKEANKDVVAIGDFLQYRVLVQNTDTAGIVSEVVLRDRLPVGMRVQTDSIRVDGQPASEFEIDADQRLLSVQVGALGTGDSRELRYVVEVGPATPLGSARNEVTAQGVGVAQANTAFVDVLVEEDLFRSKSTVIGTVWEGGCDGLDFSKPQNDSSFSKPQGMPNVRVWMEDGSFVVTDSAGKFHFAGIDPGTHVLQIDQSTLPVSHEVISCEQNTRFAGSPDSQFIDIPGGALWRTDFYVRKKPDSQQELVSRLDAEAYPDEGLVEYTLHVIGGALDIKKLNATLSLPDSLNYVGGSTRLNGLPKGDPKDYGGGMFTFRLPTTPEAFAYELSFRARIVQDASIDASAVVQLVTDTGRHRSDKITNTLSVAWPASLFHVGSSQQALPVVSRTNSAANAAALNRASTANRMMIEQDSSKEGQPSVRVQSQVFEPSHGRQKSRSETSRTLIDVKTHAATVEPYVLPELDKGDAPPFDRIWLEKHSSDIGIAWPPERYNPVMPAISVAVVHPSDLRPALLVDGDLVSPLSFEGVTKHHALGVSVTRWENVAISERDSLVQTQLQNADGETQMIFERKVHYSGRPVRAELVKGESYLVADGLFPPVIAVRLFDRAGYPLRAGTTGDFSVEGVHRPLDKTQHLENSASEFTNNKYKVLRDGIAYIQLQPTIDTGEVVLGFQFDQVRTQTIRARLVPGQKDWVMVGLAEGSFSNLDLSGSAGNLDAQNLTDERLSDGRVAFYAKGMVPGEWLLTVAYDTDKEFERTLREQIDPDQFYTLYGDGTEQVFAAQSQQKLYLKVERDRFAGLFGDFDTAFSRSELSRYERRLNGLEVGYFGENIEASVFAAETDQAFVRDELRGDGTSGVYRLSRGRLVHNSEQIHIVTRDRFALENILEEITLQRFLDYSIDFSRGQVIFKQPILSQDHQFNPVFIEVEYEVESGGADEIVAGGRLAYRLDDQESEVALTHISDDAPGVGGDLTGIDLTWQFNPLYKVTAEYAQSDTDEFGQTRASLLEVEHRSADFAGRLYFRQSDNGFGLGHQSTLETGTRKAGIEGEYRVSENILVRGQSFDQSLLDGQGERQVADLEGLWNFNRGQLRSGARLVREESADGQSRDATQLLLGGSRELLNGRLLLRTDAEVDFASAESADYPSRAIVGGEYELMRNFRLVVEQELSWADARETADTRIGFKSRPWAGADIGTTFTRQHGEEGNRLFATTGLLQQWQLNKHWLLDFGVDRVATLKEDGFSGGRESLIFNPAQPLASGSVQQDFSALFTSVAYRSLNWSASSRLEFHQGDQADKWNFLLGANRQLSEGKVVSMSGAFYTEARDDGSTADALDLRFGLAWRPSGSRWTYLNRADLEFSENSDDVFSTRARKLVNNFNANYKRQRHQISVQLGLKYVVDEIDSQEYDATTLLYGAAYRFDLTQRIDVGVNASVLHNITSDAMDQSFGLSLGYNVVRNAWVSVGYNWSGYTDDDFVAADYTSQGPFVKVRMKLDQDLTHRFLSFAGLNRDNSRPANSR